MTIDSDMSVYYPELRCKPSVSVKLPSTRLSKKIVWFKPFKPLQTSITGIISAFNHIRLISNPNLGYYDYLGDPAILVLSNIS